ncbi:MAG: tRNA pseudouridine(55) synthase TruB [Nautiliaceae bacterium]
MKNLLFVANKPMFISSNKFLSQLKKKYKEKKMGFSGTLDPFACGVLVIASGQYTKLFRFLKKSPKVYLSTLFLGASSPTLDIENITSIKEIKPFDKKEIEKVLKSFIGKQTQIPPKYSAKKIDGKRAYELARENKEVKLKEIEVEIYDIKLINYSHPFVTFETIVSEGTFIRTLGYDIAKKLNTTGTLTYLKRVKEGEFEYECEKKLNPINFLNIPQNYFLGDNKKLRLGQKLDINEFKIKEDGEYFVVYDDFFCIIKIKDKKVSYILNKISLKEEYEN